MQAFLNSPFAIGSLSLPNRLIQGPLAGYSCAVFRQLFYQFTPPAYCVSEMLSASDIVHKHSFHSRYLYRAAEETRLCYQISGNDAVLMGEAAAKLQSLGADLIDINCGCPKTKIRKKGAGSALLEQPQHLQAIIRQVKSQVNCPLTIKIRLQDNDADQTLARMATDAGVDALIVHGRRWMDDYDKPCDLEQIARIKTATHLPVIANGDIADHHSLQRVAEATGCDGFMISRAATGKPWLYEELLTQSSRNIDDFSLKKLFMTHLEGLMRLENEYQAVLQSKSLVRYYFKNRVTPSFLQDFYKLKCLEDINKALDAL